MVAQQRRESVSNGSSPAGSVDAFISYSRRDVAAAQPLVDRARALGRTFWLDTREIHPGTPWSDELSRAIESANAVVFLISDAWVGSPQCRAELARAVEFGKRLIPVILAPVNQQSVPPELLMTQWVDIRGRSATEVADTIIAAIDYDGERVREHTHWLASARRWEERGRHPSLLVRGRDLRSAEEWLGRSGVDPRPIPLQMDFVRASRRGERRRTRRLLIAAATAVVVSLSLAAVAYVQRGEAVHQRGIAVRQSNTATSRALAASAQAELALDPELSLLLARASWQAAPTTQASTALRVALEQSRVRRTIRAGSAQLSDVIVVVGGRFLLSANVDGVLQVWNASTGRLSSTLDTGALLRVVQADKPGRSGIALTTKGKLFTWKLAAATGKLTGQRVSDGVEAAGVSADGGTVFVARTDGTIATSSVGGPFTRIPSPSTELPLAVAVSSDGKVLVVGTGVRKYSAVDTGGGGHVFVSRARGTFQTLHAYGASAVAAVAVNADATRVLSTTATGSGVVQRLTDGATIASLTGVFRATMDASGRYVATTDIFGRIDLLDTGHSPIARSELAVPSEVTFGIGFSPDGALLISSGSNGFTRVWSTSDHSLRGELRASAGAVTGAAVVSGDAVIATTHEDGTLRLWRLPDEIRLPFVDTPAAVDGVDSAAYSPDGKTVLTAQATGLVRLWRADNGVETCRYRTTSAPRFCPFTSTIGLALDVNGISPMAAFSRDGSRVIVLAADESVWTFPVAGGGQPVHSAPYGTASSRPDLVDTPPGTLAVSPDGHLVVAGRGAHPPRLIDARTGRVAASLAAAASAGYQAVFTPDGRHVLVLDDDRHVDLYGLDGAHTRRVATLPKPAASLSISGDGARIAVASEDQIAVLRSVDGRRIATLIGHSGLVNDAVLSPNGQFVVSGALDGTVRTWDVSSASEINQAAPTNGPVVKVAFDATGRRILAGAASGGAVLLDCVACLSPTDLVRTAAAPEHSTRSITQVERDRYGVSTRLLK